MKLKNILLPFTSFLILSYLYPGFSFDGSGPIIFTSVVFAFFYLFIRPTLRILTIPFNFFTFGLAGMLVNILALFLIAFFVPGFEITNFHLLSLEINTFFSAVIAWATLSFILSALFFVIP